MSAIVTKKGATSKATVKQIIRAIRASENKASTAVLDYLAAQIEIGEHLIRLKKVVGHGGWTAALQQIGYCVRKAEWLMNFPGSGIDQMRISDTDLALKLPQDVLKLQTLCKLTLEQLRKAFADGGWYLDVMTREMVAAAVKDVLAGKWPEIPSTTSDDKADIDAKNPNQHRDMPQQVAYEQPQRAGNHRAEENDVAEDHEGNGADDNVGEEQAADSGLNDAIDEVAKAIYDQVILAAQERVQGPGFKVQGQRADDLFQAILRRLCALLTRQQGSAAV